jgi:hypothetical protein
MGFREKLRKFHALQFFSQKCLLMTFLPFFV